ncbi:hypothetical protein HanOQP8_Chr02g0053461 [Helianthus annuus]|nr:hypothetical protein HanOQP8_Chr02g0053461 [Helianthus annuus]
MPYKFLVHSIIHAMGHRKGGYDVVDGYVMCMITTLVLNLPYNFSKLVFEQMKANIDGEKFLQYPRFIQMILDDKIKNLAKVDSDVLPLEHMMNMTLDRLQQYKKVKKEEIPKVTRMFGCLKEANYLGPPVGKWRHDDTASGDESTKMEDCCKEMQVVHKGRW